MDGWNWTKNRWKNAPVQNLGISALCLWKAKRNPGSRPSNFKAQENSGSSRPSTFADREFHFRSQIQVAVTPVPVELSTWSLPPSYPCWGFSSQNISFLQIPRWRQASCVFHISWNLGISQGPGSDFWSINSDRRTRVGARTSGSALEWPSSVQSLSRSNPHIHAAHKGLQRADLLPDGEKGEKGDMSSL